MFPIKVNNSTTVGELKQFIKGQKQHDLADIDADNLTLRKVNISHDKLQEVEFSELKTLGPELTMLACVTFQMRLMCSHFDASLL